MTDAVKRGLEKSGDVPGPFKYPKRAREMYEKALSKRASLIFTNKVFAYALAVSEENLLSISSPSRSSYSAPQ